MVSLFFKLKQKCNRNVIIYTCIIFASNLYFILKWLNLKHYVRGFNMKKIKILVVDDEIKLLHTVTEFLTLQNFSVMQASSGSEALKIFTENKKEIELILLDLMLPDISGYSVLREIRKISDVPVIILSARSEVTDQMNGFEKGADDYITKPFSLGLVKLHIEAVLKRAGKMKNILDYGKIRIEKGRQLVYREDEILEMTRREYELLLYFMEHKETVLSRETILNAVWDYDYAGDVRTVDTLVKQIRKKLGDDCNYIHTVYGVGYLFEDKADER